MVKTYNGNSPRNARIKIDYTGESPSVRFQYPRRDGYQGSMVSYFTIAWFALLVIIFYSSSIAIGIHSHHTSEVPQSGIEMENNLTNNHTQDSSEIVEKEERLKQLNEEIKEENKKLMNMPLTLFLAALILFLPPFLIDKLFKKKLNRFYPVFQAWLSKKKYVSFKAKDIKTSNVNKKEEIYVEIPYFENVILKYKATKDFSKSLTVMEIKEQNFKFEEESKVKKGAKKGAKKGKYKKTKKQNEWYWYARFYFSKRPKEGKLEVIFK